MIQRRSGIVADGTVAQDSTQAGAIWTLRESISDGLRHRGACAAERKSLRAVFHLC